MEKVRRIQPNLIYCSHNGCTSTGEVEACCICYRGCCELHRNLLKLEIESSSTRSLDDLRYGSRILRPICTACDEMIRYHVLLESEAPKVLDFDGALKTLLDPLFLQLATSDAKLEFSDENGIWLFRVRKGSELVYSFKIYRTLPVGMWYLVDLDHTRIPITKDRDQLRDLTTALIWRYFDHSIPWQALVYRRIEAKLAEIVVR